MPRSLYFRPNRKQLRPGRPRKKDGPLNKNMRVSIEVLQMLYLERKRHETYNDVLLRILRERNFQRMEVPPPTPAAA